jgi:gamma-glutamyl-gamma-aminobutyrate hydrolase PuuD
MRPVVGITSYPAERVKWGVWEEPVIMIPAAYAVAVEHAGGRPLILPPSDDSVDATIDLVDAIIFSGGGDLDPRAYGAEPHPETDSPRRERDDAELALLTAPSSATCPSSPCAAAARC